MTVINATLASVVNRYQAATTQTIATQTTDSQTSAGGFGNAVNLTLSAPAQAALVSQNTASGSGASSGNVPPVIAESGSSPVIGQAGASSASGAASGGGQAGAAQGGHHGGGGGGPIGGASSGSGSGSGSAAEELLVEEAKAQVIPKVGVTGADEVVDSKGDIDQVKLEELEAQQAAQQSAIA